MAANRNAYLHCIVTRVLLVPTYLRNLSLDERLDSYHHSSLAQQYFTDGSTNPNGFEAQKSVMTTRKRPSESARIVLLVCVPSHLFPPKLSQITRLVREVRVNFTARTYA